jgi:hypothetical protein
MSISTIKTFTRGAILYLRRNSAPSNNESTAFAVFCSIRFYLLRQETWRGIELPPMYRAARALQEAINDESEGADSRTTPGLTGQSWNAIKY